jgi:transmembrane sensor
MSELEARVRAVGGQVDAGYDAQRTEVALGGLRAKLRRRRAGRVALVSATGMVCLLAGTLWALRPAHEPRSRPTGTRPETAFSLGDGSVVTPLDGTSRVVARKVSPERVELELVAGSAHFDVAPNRAREFRVSAGRVEIVVVGTKFTVARLGERTLVAVQGGRVRVEWERGQQILEPGERGDFPPFEPASEAASASEPEAPDTQPQPRVAPARTGTGSAAADWRVLAKHGDYPAAYRMMHDKAKPVSPSDTDDLLLAADVARRSGHAKEAVPYLERALSVHRSDAQIAVVAFTLGRVRQSELGDPDGAADAFARARAVSPHGPLAEDALAREVEARFHAGDPTRAHALAEEYLKTWPSGTWLRAVRHFGGLP